MVTKLGHWFLIRFDLFSDIFTRILQALKNGLPGVGKGTRAVRSVLLRQIYFTGWQASGIVITIAILLGIVIITQIISLVGLNGSLTGKILVWVVMRELAPLLTSIVIIARSGTAIATELGNMKLNGELEALEMMGIAPDQYLVSPRIAGVTISVVILTVYSVLFSFIASFLSASAGWHIPFEQFSQGVISAISFREIFIFCSKTLFFGLFISATCCSFGLSVRQSSTEIPQVATKAVMTSLFALFLLDGVITYLASLALE